MSPWVLTVLLVVQIDSPIPPAPAAPVAAASETSAESMRSWLLARLILDQSFNEAQAAEASRLLARMNVSQLDALVAAYKERNGLGAADPDNTEESPALKQARHELRLAEALRDQLRAELRQRLDDRAALQAMTWQTLAIRSQVSPWGAPYTYGGIVIGPYGLAPGIVNYGGWGIGAPHLGAAWGSWETFP